MGDAAGGDPSIDIICSAAIPSERAAIAIAAMQAGKDVMVDKPGITSFQQFEEVRRTVKDTRRIFSICFSERFVVPSTEVALRLIRDGVIGEEALATQEVIEEILAVGRGRTDTAP